MWLQIEQSLGMEEDKVGKMRQWLQQKPNITHKASEVGNREEKQFVDLFADFYAGLLVLFVNFMIGVHDDFVISICLLIN